MTEDKTKKSEDKKTEKEESVVSDVKEKKETKQKEDKVDSKKEKKIEKTDSKKDNEKEKINKKDVDEEKTVVLEVKKDNLGLEELPEDIVKKLEKKKAENEQKHAKKGKKARKKRKKKEAKRITVGKAYIKATYNNTIVTLTDMSGNVISWASAGIAGFKGPKKSTPYAASIITRIAVGKAKEEYGLNEVSVYVRGIGTGRESAIRALNSNGLTVTLIKDITPIPHNGCRTKKPRRV